MKINDLRKILQENNIYKFDYSLSEDDPPRIECVLCIRKRSDGFDVYSTERDDIVESHSFKSEDEACDYFLLDLSYDYKQLKKYVK